MIEFEITSMPLRLYMTILDVAVVANVKYPIEQQSDLKINNQIACFGEPFDSFKWNIYKNNLKSVNEGIVEINYKTNKEGVPPEITIVKQLEIGSSFFFTNEVYPDSHFDRITILEIIGKGKWFYNSAEILPGQSFFFYQLLNNMFFIANEPGAKNNYSLIKWITGNIERNHSFENSISVNTFYENGAELILNPNNATEVNSDGTLITHYFSGSIINGISEANYKLHIDTLDYVEIDEIKNVQIKQINGPSLNINTAEIVMFESVLNSNGEINFDFIIIKPIENSNEINIIVTLFEINLLTDNINEIKNQITLTA